VSIVPQGGNTGLCGGATPDGGATNVVVSLKRMNRVRDIDTDNNTLTVEAGCILQELQRVAAQADRLFPLSLGSEGAATIGGLLSTNAGGVHVLRYGMMRELTLGIEAVLPGGRVLKGLKSLRKDNTGYDLKQLFIGAEGTLGVITAASLKLFPRSRAHIVALAKVSEPDHALALLHRVKAETGALSAFEIMNRLAVTLTQKHVPDMRDPMPGAPYLVLLEFDSASVEGLRDAVEGALSAAIEAGEAQDVLIAESEAQARAFWKLREAIPLGHRPEGAQTNHDISVPVSATPAFLFKARGEMERLCPGVRIVAFGHMGDGNFHYTLIPPEGADAALLPGAKLSDAVNEIAVGMGGSF